MWTLADRINTAATTPATTKRGDPLPDWLQPFDENLANNEGDEQKKGEQEAAAPFARSSAAAAPTMPDDDDELMVDEEVVKEHDPDEQHGDRKIIKVHDPKLPTEEEVQQHLMCHLPHRNWCHHCIRGRGRERDHRRRLEDHVERIPEYHLHYCFPRDEMGQLLTILVAVERYSRMKKAVVVPSKGSTGMYAARMVLELISECGDKDRDVKTARNRRLSSSWTTFVWRGQVPGRSGPKELEGVQWRRRKSGPVRRAIRQDFEVGVG